MSLAYDFNADDVFEMAEQIERNGYQFYTAAAEGIDDPENKKMLKMLAQMEAGHEKTFAKMRNELSSKEKQSTVFDPSGEAAQYLKALADTKVFFEKQIDITSMEEILKSAITAEKDSIVFYLGMKDLVPGSLGQDKIDDVIKEEMRHITILSKELMAIGK